MPNKIQRYAAGLLNLTGITGGRAPDQLADEIRPTLDLTEYYAVRNLASTREIGTVNALGSVVDVDVPTGQIWRVLCVDTRITGTTAGQVISIGTSIRVGGSGDRIRILSPDARTVVTNADEETFSTGPVSFYLPPGSVIQGRIRHPVGAAVTMGVGVLYQLLTV